MQEETKHLREDPLQKKERRGIEKVVTLNVQQISASKQQVRRDSIFSWCFIGVVVRFIVQTYPFLFGMCLAIPGVAECAEVHICTSSRCSFPSAESGLCFQEKVGERERKRWGGDKEEEMHTSR